MAMAWAGSASAQDKTVGRKGVKTLSLDGSVTARQQDVIQYNSRGIPIGTTQEWTGDYNAGLDIGRFLSDFFVLNTGLFFGGQIDGSSSDLGVNIGARLYFAPHGSFSPYATGGGGLFTMMSDDGSGNTVTSSAGSFFGGGGLEGALKDNATLFMQLVYESLQFEGGSQKDIRAQVGIRVLFQ
jgi:hypothetical protein